eukprot:6185490-Pleurochrysis_carterae.AAC.5
MRAARPHTALLHVFAQRACSLARARIHVYVRKCVCEHKSCARAHGCRTRHIYAVMSKTAILLTIALTHARTRCGRARTHAHAYSRMHARARTGVCARARVEFEACTASSLARTRART